jgi:diguanylate cyclase (GGDEF)-like protein
MVSGARSLVDARRAAWLFVLAGALSMVNAWAPGVCPADQRPSFTALGLLDVAVGGVLAVLPWHRWSRRTLVAIPVVTLVMVDLFAVVGRLDPWIYSVFFILLAIWAGLSMPRWTLARLAPVVAGAYVLPLIVSGRAHAAVVSVGLIVPVVVVVAELIAREVDGLRKSSLRDELTGIGNRRLGMEALERLRPGDAVLLLDLDRFKQVNDRYGHAEGDAVLAALGSLLSRSMRRADTVARLGGEEFLVIADQVGPSAWELAHRLCAEWRRTAPRTTVSVGVTVHDTGEPATETLARADGALYEAKRAGRDRVSYAPRRAVRHARPAARAQT